MSVSGIATRETTWSRQMERMNQWLHKVWGRSKKWYPFSRYMGLPSSAYNMGVQTQYNARRVLYQKDIFSILDQSYPFHKWGLPRVPQYRTTQAAVDNSLPVEWDCAVSILVISSATTCVHSTQLTLQGHMMTIADSCELISCVSCFVNWLVKSVDDFSTGMELNLRWGKVEGFEGWPFPDSTSHSAKWCSCGILLNLCVVKSIANRNMGGVNVMELVLGWFLDTEWCACSVAPIPNWMWVPSLVYMLRFPGVTSISDQSPLSITRSVILFPSLATSLLVTFATYMVFLLQSPIIVS